MPSTCTVCLGVGRLEPQPPTSGFGRGPLESWPSCGMCDGTGKDKPSGSVVDIALRTLMEARSTDRSAYGTGWRDALLAVRSDLEVRGVK